MGTWENITIGHAWIIGYSCFDKEEEFEWLIK